jgi:DNA repair exonuclease SbcCD ATPase subunit
MIKQKILEFALKNWKAILIVLLLVVIALKNSHDYKLMQTAYETQIESYQAQVDGLKEIHKREIEEKQLLMESFLESISEIEEEYKKAQEELEVLREKKNNEYKRKFRHDKEALIKDIETKFGIEYAP